VHFQTTSKVYVCGADGESLSTSLAEAEEDEEQLSATGTVVSPSTPAQQDRTFAVNSPVLSTTFSDTLGWTLYCLRVSESESADTAAFQGFECGSRNTSAQLGAEPNLSL
jgi:hypothetical protein